MISYQDVFGEPYAFPPESATLPGLYDVSVEKSKPKVVPPVKKPEISKIRGYKTGSKPKGNGIDTVGAILGGALGLTASVYEIGSALQNIPHQPNTIYIVNDGQILGFIALCTLGGAYIFGKLAGRAKTDQNRPLTLGPYNER